MSTKRPPSVSSRVSGRRRALASYLRAFISVQSSLHSSAMYIIFHSRFHAFSSFSSAHLSEICSARTYTSFFERFSKSGSILIGIRLPIRDVERQKYLQHLRGILVILYILFIENTVFEFQDLCKSAEECFFFFFLSFHILCTV